jgi:hypothetical protein
VRRENNSTFVLSIPFLLSQILQYYKVHACEFKLITINFSFKVWHSICVLHLKKNFQHTKYKVSTTIIGQQLPIHITFFNIYVNISQITTIICYEFIDGLFLAVLLLFLVSVHKKLFFLSIFQYLKTFASIPLLFFCFILPLQYTN